MTAGLTATPVLGLVAVTAVMVILWIASLRLRDASIVDIFWGFSFALVAWVYFATTDGFRPRSLLVAALVTVWGLRLSAHLYRRNRGQREDYRYREMRESWGSKFPWVSLATVFLLQASILWVVSFPLWQAMRSPSPDRLTLLDGLGVALFVLGFLFEAIGDRQLERFKADPANRGKILTSGLWRYTRHPNYFGDALVWWGLAVVALATPGAAWTLISPVLMTGLLMKVSGVALLERRLKETKPGYRDYVERTSSFFPWPPRKSAPTRTPSPGRP